ncbi:hypothetical protein JOE46_000162 [Rhodococcus sp. PvR099]|uniref:DUF3515 domain-containing protein n=1 Tax=Rhodococcus sp. PvR044 TaxID=3156402 RepID=UPI001B7B1CC8|nr:MULTISPECIES: DUF3515 domain-containing protein [Rhodococcus]MBP1158003.1 hypothetical protein [Rhodococcus sp. PvR099]MCZ4554388.1 DUF3515 domain-containing protein [Rhodococcus maanshanensis]
MNDPDLPDSADAPEPTEPHPTARRSPALIAVAVALPVALVVGVLVAAVIAGRDPIQEPVALGTVPAPAAESPECAALIAALPENLGDFERAELMDPAPVGAAAWQADDAKEVVLRCGVDRPLEFNAASPLTVVDAVQWFEVPGEEGLDASTWFAVDRGVYVALTVPHGSGPTPLQDASAAITSTLEQRPLDPAPIPTP